jgi:hypothetical protein
MIGQPLGLDPNSLQNTPATNAMFWTLRTANSRSLSNAKDALLQKVGLVKVWWEERDLESRDTFYNQSDDAWFSMHYVPPRDFGRAPRNDAPSAQT